MYNVGLYKTTLSKQSYQCKEDLLILLCRHACSLRNSVSIASKFVFASVVSRITGLARQPVCPSVCPSIPI